MFYKISSVKTIRKQIRTKLYSLVCVSSAEVEIPDSVHEKIKLILRKQPLKYIL